MCNTIQLLSLTAKATNGINTQHVYVNIEKQIFAHAIYAPPGQIAIKTAPSDRFFEYTFRELNLNLHFRTDLLSRNKSEPSRTQTKLLNELFYSKNIYYYQRRQCHFCIFYITIYNTRRLFNNIFQLTITSHCYATLLKHSMHFPTTRNMLYKSPPDQQTTNAYFCEYPYHIIQSGTLIIN